MAPWIMTQRWNDLLFMHYSFAPEVVRALVPEILTLDIYAKRAWVSVTPFWINHLRPPGVPSLPWVSHFAEINVRTYVSYGGRPGIFFFSLDASNLSAVWGARIFYRLPYWQASMKVAGKGGPKIDYLSKREHGPKPAELKCSYGPDSAKWFQARPGSLEHFLSERYCLYAIGKKRLYRGEIHHLPWQLQQASLELRQNTMAQPAGLHLPDKPELAYFSRELKVLFWAPERLL
jgi:uncharacterized protein YqjF (DUF2071 family)